MHDTTGKTLVPLSRRRVLQLAAAGGATVTITSVLPLRPALAAGRSLTWISPRGYVETADDFHHQIALKLGYYGDLAVDYLPGPQDGTATVKFPDQGQSDLGSPGPGVFSLGIDKGLDLTYIFSKHPVDIFSFAFRKGEAVRDVHELEGKSVLLGSIGWKPIVDAELAQFGIDTTKVESLEAGQGWGQALAAGNGDSALVWEGLRAEWHAKGFDFDYLSLTRQSRFPANGEVVKGATLADPEKRQLYSDYARGLAKGLEFAWNNPVAAAAIFAETYPQVAAKLTPESITEHVVQLSNTTRGPLTAQKGWGFHDISQYQTFFDVALKIGTISKPIDASKVISNDLIAYANDFDHGAVKADAEGYPLPAAFKAVDLAPILGRNPRAYS